MRPMTGIRGDLPRGGLLPLVIALTLTLGGCAPATPQEEAATPTPTVSLTPTAACPQVEGVELPPECAPYDPDHAMAQNDRHRERMGLSEEAQAVADETIPPIRAALDALRAAGELSPDAVEDVLTEAGLTGIRTTGDQRAVEFGADAPAGGCVFGQVSAEVLTVEAGGYILDGGCLPAQ